MSNRVGNQAVSNLLQRDDREKTPVSGPGDFGVSGGEPQSSGTVTAKPDGDGVRAESPDVKYQPAKVWLQEGKTLGGSQNFGFVQNLVTSTRGAVYRRGGDPAGDITSEPREGHGKAYDAVSDPNDDTKINKRVFPPFYWPPSSTGVTVDIACDTTHVNLGKDILSASVLRDGQLIRSEGGIRLNSGDSHSLSLTWSETFGSAANIKSGTVLKVELYVTKNNW